MKIQIGKDEFCIDCAEWREYDENGRCKVCGKIIKKIVNNEPKNGYERYKTESPSFECEEEADSSEY